MFDHQQNRMFCWAFQGRFLTRLSNWAHGVNAILKLLKTMGVWPRCRRRLVVPTLLALFFISLHPFPFMPLVEVSAQRPVNDQARTEQTAGPEEASKSVARLLENLELLLDAGRYEEVQAEWIRIAPFVQQVKLKEELAEQLTAFYARRIRKLLAAGEHRQATAQWEQAVASHPQVGEGLGEGLHRDLIWAVPRAYVKINEHEKAIRLFREHFYESPMPGNYETPEDAEQRAQFGELLLFGKNGTTGEDSRAIGRAQCALCHGFFEDPEMVAWEGPPRGPHLFDFVPRIKEVISSPQYQQWPRNTVEPEAFPGSGMATSVIEYLAESMVCPNCFVVPGFGVKGTQDRESSMPKSHKPPIGLTVEEMIAIDTWMLVHDGAEIPSLSEMRAAYDKFLPTEDRLGALRALFLASLYDAKGDLVEALRLVEEHYPRVWRREPKETVLGHYFRKWRNDRGMFVHMKQQSDLVKKFPLLLQSP